MNIMGLLSFIFRPKNDFHGMLKDQSSATLKGIRLFCTWIKTRNPSVREQVIASKDSADGIRFEMEEKLMEAFSTPFDRQDIYSFSIEMNKIFRSVLFAMRLMDELKVQPNEHIYTMANNIFQCFRVLDSSLELLELPSFNVKNEIQEMRDIQERTEASYIMGMKDLLSQKDLQENVNTREVFMSLKEANSFLVYTVDVFHKIVVRIT